MPSPLSFASTQTLRTQLLVRNLEPYSEGGFVASSTPSQGGLVQTNYSVIDSPNVVDVGEQEENFLITKNLYGPSGGYNNPINITDIQRVIEKRDTYFKFVSSFYTPFQILFQNNPVGSSGSLSQDSVMMQISARSLRNELQFRVDENVRRETLGRLNFLNALKDPFLAADIIRGANEFIEPDWTISSPTNLVGKGLDYISRISGVYVPFSWIPGDYFDPEGRRSFINQAVNFVGGLFTDDNDIDGGIPSPKLLPERRSGSDVFLNNTGRGQTSMLFKLLSYNDFRPDYKANFISDLNLFAPSGAYYVGSRTQSPTDVLFPNNELPVDYRNRRVQAAVRGYGQLSTLYEGEDQNFKFGLDAPLPSEEGGLQGGFTWISPQTRAGAGKKGGVGGAPGSEDENWNDVSATFNSTISTNYSFKQGSIMDETQRLINSADGLGGRAKLQHVGNAINQVSKVFFDGTREITKGSKVMSFIDQNGDLVGTEYCRVFTKDNPYFKMNDLQKTDGNIRKFTYSVMDNTYNLNIAPNYGNDSTNIIDGQVKKYMLSLENLAWRTTDLQQDLPSCEKGPNGGRIMWFPPYDLKVDETISVRWTQNEFLGRPEPVYTYNNTQRQGSLSFKIVVDHPSILNLLIDKELANVTPDSKITKIVDSFFAGCKKYDIYELARKFGQLSVNEIYEIVTKTKDNEQFQKAKEELPQPTEGETTVVENVTEKPSLSEFEGATVYFDNNTPSPSSGVVSNESYGTVYSNYIANQGTYQNQSNVSVIDNFFSVNIVAGKERLDVLITQVAETIEKGYTVDITLKGYTSSLASANYNEELSKRRVDAVRQYILSDQRISKINQQTELGKVTVNYFGFGESECNSDNEVYTTTAMECRRVEVTNITIFEPRETEQDNTLDETEAIQQQTNPTTGTNDIEDNNTPLTRSSDEVRLREGVTKKLLRKLLTECNYFESITDDTSFLYEGMKEKIKYFNPVFHSMTPEGLNSRLTFLQQCLRPGDTIPTIGPDGKPLDNDALNTSFGVPPICVLRVGDFFHTKIAINQMSIRYEPLQLDLNPEGIGVQPMLADVNLSFYFIGGHGLKEPVQQLQNALSFNYYANTEMYDERATATEDTKKIDLETIEALGLSVPFSQQDVAGSGDRDGGTTIGEITSQNITNSGQTITGTIKYQKNMDDLVVNTKTYSDALTKTLEDINEEFGQSGLFMFTKDRKYVNGSMKTTVNQTDLYGKSENLQDKIDLLFKEVLNDVDTEDSPLLLSIDTSGGLKFKFSQQPSFKNSEVRKYKKLVKNILSEYKDSFSINMNNLQSDLINAEQILISNIDKLNYVYSLNDGFIQPNGQVVIYSLSATTNVYDPNGSATDTLLELEQDIDLISAGLNGTILLLESKNLISGDYSDSWNFDLENNSIASPAEIRLFTVIQKDVLGSNNIKNRLLQWVESETLVDKVMWRNTINAIFDIVLVPSYTGQKTKMESQFTDYKNSAIIGNTYEPYALGKIREFNFSDSPTQSQTQVEGLRNLYSGVNSGPANKWNNKVKLD